MTWKRKQEDMKFTIKITRVVNLPLEFWTVGCRKLITWSPKEVVTWHKKSCHAIRVKCVNRRFSTFRWPPVHGLPHMDYQMDYPNGLSNGLPRWTTHMDYLINYPRKRKERNITPSLFILIEFTNPPSLLFSFCVNYHCSDGCRRNPSSRWLARY